MENAAVLKNTDKDFRLNRVVLICALTTALIGLLVLAGWTFGLSDLNSMGKGFIPMAEETALLFLITGIALALLRRKDKSRILHYFIIGSSVFIGVVAVLALIDFATAYQWNLSDFMGKRSVLKVGIVTGKISWLTAICFILVSIALLLLPTKAKKYSIIFSSLILFTGYIISVGYAYGVPFLYGGTAIPVAWPTAIAFIISSAGLLIAVGKETAPVSYFIEDSTRARLLRSILPVIFLLMLAHDFIDAFTNEGYSSSSALTKSIVDIVVLLVTGAIISLMSRSIGKSIDRNIAERKQAEEVVKEKESLLRRVLEKLPIGVWITDANGTIIQGNEAGQMIWSGIRYVGLEDYGEYKGWWANTGKQIEPEEWSASRAIKKGETSLNEEIIIECFDGTRKTILNSALPLREADQKIIGSIIINQDITERKQAEEDLKLSEQRYRFSLESTGQIGWSTPPDGVVEDMPMWREYSGQSLEEVVGWKWLDAVHPDDRESAYNAWSTAATQKINYFTEYRIRRADGVYRNFMVRGIPLLNADGSCKEWVGTCIDITKRKLVEQKVMESQAELSKALEESNQSRQLLLSVLEDQLKAQETLRETNDYLESLFNFTTAPIFVWDPTLKITRFNHAFEQLSGFDAAEVIGQQVNIFFPEDKVQSSLSLINKTAGGEQWDSVEIEILRKDKKTKIVVWNSSNIFDKAGKTIVATIALGYDITERKHAEEEIQNQLDELRRWYEVTLDREGRVLELKQEVNELLKQSGEPLRYEIVK